jgi:ActR/RegA family two-component response regulator
MKIMFSYYENISVGAYKVKKLKFEVPLDLRMINIGNGLKETGDGAWITTDDILSKPMLALIEGMTTPGLKWSGQLSIDTKGYFGLIVGNIVDHHRSDTVMGSSSYAFVSGNYVNFFSRLGYHFSSLDAYAGDEINNNYINFNFRGGASSITRRSRRALAIAKILDSLNFTVQRSEDNVIAKIRKIPENMICKLVAEIGKLMGAIRNTDVIMQSDAHVDLFAEAFLEGDPNPALRLNAPPKPPKTEKPVLDEPDKQGINEEPNKLIFNKYKWYAMEKKIRLLIVDDEVKFLDSIAERLILRGLDVSKASNGKDAIEAARKEKYDLALLDLKMPGLDGKEVLEILKKEHKFIEVIILTGHGSLESAVECTKLGAYGYLPKPYELDQLLNVLKEAYEARMKKKFAKDEERMQKLINIAIGSSPLAIMRAMNEIDDEER